MDNLPASLVLEILSRIEDSADLVRCRLVSKTLNSLLPEVRSINLQCSYSLYAKSRSALTAGLITPFKEAFKKLVFELNVVEAISVGVEKPLRSVSYDDVEDEDDLFLSDVNFISQWLHKVAGDLKSLSISDFWVQSCWRRSCVLSLVSTFCVKLVELDIKNAWLSFDDVVPMANLTTLTLEFIRLDDENLENLNECFPCLQELNLIGVGGLKDPRIHLMHLKTCHWLVSNAPNSISVTAPRLVKLTLTCVKPNCLLIRTPLLSTLNLSLDSACNFTAGEFSLLKNLHLESTNLRKVLAILPFGASVTNLTAVSSRWHASFGVPKSVLELLLSAFPNVSSLTLTAGIWSEIESYFPHECLEPGTDMKTLKEIRAYLTINELGSTLATIYFLLDNCSQLQRMTLLIHSDVVSKVTYALVSACKARSAKVVWKWGIWKEGDEDSWFSDSNIPS